MTGNGAARGQRGSRSTETPCRGATPAEKAAIMRGLVIRHPHGTVHALASRCAPRSCLVCANTSTSLEGADGAASQFCRVL